jgi:succinate-acetate transporter protein
VSSQTPVAAAPVVSIADPAPLGLAGFAMTTFVLSAFNTNVLNSSLDATVLSLALFYGGIGQLLAGMWEFRRGNTFAATAFSSYGAFWLAYWWLVEHDVASLVKATDAAELHKALGLFLLSWTIFTAYMTIAALRVSGAVLAVFVALTITFVLLTIGKFATGDTAKSFTHIGGWFGFLTAILAWYASFAGVTNSTFAKTVIPTWPLANRGVVARP